jgi:hypothetical protein
VRIPAAPDDVTFDQAKLVLFKYSIGKTAKDWLFLLPSGIIQTWKELEDRFLDRFFTEEQYMERKKAIIEFQQEKRESLHQSLERFKLYRRRYPNHYLCAAELMQIFVNSMSVKYRMLLNASAEGTIKNKTPAEVEELIEMMSRNEYNKAEDIDERDILLEKMVTSELEIERLVKKIEEITPQKKRDEHATRRESEA